MFENIRGACQDSGRKAIVLISEPGVQRAGISSLHPTTKKGWCTSLPRGNLLSFIRSSLPCRIQFWTRGWGAIVGRRWRERAKGPQILLQEPPGPRQGCRHRLTTESRTGLRAGKKAGQEGAKGSGPGAAIRASILGQM